MIKDITLLLLKKGVITIDELNACQKECSGVPANYMFAKEEEDAPDDQYGDLAEKYDNYSDLAAKYADFDDSEEEQA